MNENSSGKNSTNADEIDEFSRSVQHWGNRYIAEYARSVKRYAAFVDNLTKRDSDYTATTARDPELQRRYAEFVLNETPHVLGRLAEAGLSYYQQLADESIDAVNRYYEQVLQQPDTVPSPASTVAPRNATSTALVFHGVRGESASNAFLVTNNRSEPIEVAFEVSDIISDDGVTRVKPTAQFTPQRYTLAPQEKQVVQCSILLTEDYERSQIHSGSILVAGFPDMSMRIDLQVEDIPTEPSIQAQPNQELSARKRASRKKASTRKKSSR